MSTKLKTIHIDTRPFDVHVDEEGKFFARWQGENLFAPSLKGLEEKLRKTVRSAGRIAVPATRISDSWHNQKVEITHIVLTGIHAGNGNVLYREEGSHDVEQIRSFDDEIYRRLSVLEIEQYEALKRTIKAAEEALEEWKVEHKINTHQAMTEAQAALETATP